MRIVPSMPPPIDMSVSVSAHAVYFECKAGRSTADMQAAEEPKHQKNDQYQAQSAAEPSSTIPVVPVVATTATEQQDDQDNDQNRAHLPPSLSTPDSAPNSSEHGPKVLPISRAKLHAPRISI